MNAGPLVFLLWSTARGLRPLLLCQVFGESPFRSIGQAAKTVFKHLALPPIAKCFFLGSPDTFIDTSTFESSTIPSADIYLFPPPLGLFLAYVLLGIVLVPPGPV